jgi:hypothetical protein
LTVKEILDEELAMKLDDYMNQAYMGLHGKGKDSVSAHRNGLIFGSNCKTEAWRLINDARSRQKTETLIDQLGDIYSGAP